MSKAIIDSLNRNARQEAIENADQVEWKALSEGSAIFEYGIADELISGEMLDEAELVEESDADSSIGDPAWIGRSEIEECKTSAVAEEIERRSLILKDQYPFRVDGQRIDYQPTLAGIYEFCLAVSISRKLTERPYNELPQAFEALSTQILIAWMGPGAKGWQTGFPGRAKAGLPSKLPDLWDLIHEETGEWQWEPGKDVPDDAPDHQKDLGVDLLIWKSIGDYRTHALFLAGQCACGRDAMRGNGKGADLNPKWLEEWFRLRGKVEFVPCLLMPRCLGGCSTDLRARAGQLFFDRIRLVMAAADSPALVLDDSSRDRYAKLVDLVKGDVH